MQTKPFYNGIVTDRNLHPAHKHALPDANYVLRGVNPSCGDTVSLQLMVDQDGIIRDGAFTGDGCAVSQASADLMIDVIIGKPVSEAVHLADVFGRYCATGEDMDAAEMAEMRDIAALSKAARRGRMQCMMLPWTAFYQVVKHFPK